MILFDNIISKLQSGGGVTVYFNNLLHGCKKNNIEYLVASDSSECHRLFERYRNCIIDRKEGVFHSSYYRLPSQRSPKVVTTVHDFTYEKFVTGPAQWVHTWQKNRAIRNSDLIICVSHNTARDLMQYCPVDESRIRVIHNGVSDSYRQLPIRSDFNYNSVLFVGARGGYKNFHLAIDAVAAVVDLELHIVGGGALSSDEVAQLEKKLPGRYRWLGRLSDEELNVAYNQAYALLYPSSYEGFGIPVIEAMRAGCPVIAVNVSSIPEVAGEAAILVDSPSSFALRDALNAVSERRQQLVVAGLAQAAKFSWDRCFDETLAVYNELL
ncbi:glycosyltransferase family 4 protein [Aeromonas sp. MR19]|uniref:glycosyltransferase family 4 protein n=1 Tax=Aeromonas sp. MR19 TaxID=2923421 RepID=UPI001F4A4A6A|nr:glycosyltransferase family 4 protein [Aeromonas sp. MR19]